MCCEFDEEDFVGGADVGSAVSFRFEGDLFEMLSRVAFPDGNYTSKFFFYSRIKKKKKKKKKQSHPPPDTFRDLNLNIDITIYGVLFII